MKLLKLVLVMLAMTLGLSLQPPAVSAGGSLDDLIVLNYHDVGKLKNEYMVTPATLRQHFMLLKKLGYHPISVSQYLAATKQQAQLPDKPVMITFDDGYLSFYSEVFPLLKEFQYPAVMALVTSWMQSGAPGDIGPIINWDQAREMEASGLVTFASHSHALHYFLPINPYDDRNTATSSFQYNKGHYESEEEFSKRLQADMEASQRVLVANLGHPVSAYVWPYGEYNLKGVQLAKAAGFELLFTLSTNINNDVHQNSGLRRIIVENNPDESSFLKLLTQGEVSKPLKVGQLDIDLIYDESPSQFEENLDTAIYFLQRSGANTVFLQAFCDDQGSGNISSVYFYTTAAPVKKDVFSHVARRLGDAGFRVYAWMPTLACQWLLKNHPEDEVLALELQNKGWYRRATPFSPRVRTELKALFRDLAAYSPIDGILFQDDLYLNDYEDASAAAAQIFRERFQRELTTAIVKDKTVMADWTKLKTQALSDLTVELINEVRQYRPQAMTARNIYPIVITSPESSTWIGQDYSDFLKLYDFTVIMAYPYLEKESNPADWLTRLARASLANPAAAQKTIFKLQAYDWTRHKWISSRVIADQLKVLKANGAMQIAYYPLNIYTGKEEFVGY